MKENFDDKLSSKIKATFENHQEPFDPSLWEEMQNRLQKKKEQKAFYRSRTAWFIFIGFFTILGGGLAYWAFQHSGTPALSAEAILENVETSPAQNQSSAPRIEPKTELEKPGKAQIPKAPKLSNPSEQKVENIEKTTASNISLSTREGNKQVKSSQIIPNRSRLNKNPLNIPLGKDSAFARLPEKTINAQNQYRRPGERMSRIPRRDLRVDEPVFRASKYPIAIVVRPRDSTNTEASSFSSPLRWHLVFQALKGSQRGEESPYVSNLSFGAGFMVEKAIFPKMSVATGLILNQQKWKRDNTFLRAFESSQNNLPSNISSSSNLRLKEELRATFLEVPIDLNYVLWQKRKYHLSLGLGFSSLWYLQDQYIASQDNSQSFAYDLNDWQEFGQSVEILNESKEANKTGPAWKAFQLFNLKARFSYQLNEKYRLNFSPFYQRSLGKMTSEQIKTHFLGLRLGLEFRK